MNRLNRVATVRHRVYHAHMAKKKNTVKDTVKRKGHQLPTRVSESVWEMLKEVAREQRRSVAQTVAIFVEDSLRALGKVVPTDKETK